MTTNKKVIEGVTDLLSGLVANFYGERIVKLVQHTNKCLNCNGSYVEK
jgi:hypothetical protein